MKNLFTWVVVLCFLICFTSVATAQLYLTNPSFEGAKGANGAPAGWASCGWCCIPTPPGGSADCSTGNAPELYTSGGSNGTNYVGLQTAKLTGLGINSEHAEAISQQLCRPMLAGITYTMSIDVATATGAGLENGSLEIWGGYYCCRWNSKLWSGTVTTTNWQTKTITFIPSENYTHLFIKAKDNNLSNNNNVTVFFDNIKGTVATGCPATNGCSNSGLQYNQCSADISPCKTPTITVSPSAPSVCPGTTVTLTASGGYWYTWSTGATTTSIAVTPSVTTTYTLSGNSSVLTCSSTASVKVTIYPVPTIAVSPALPAICYGKDIVLTATGASTYSWSGGPVGATYLVNPLTATVYSVTGQSAVGCTNKTTVQVNINPLPSPTVSYLQHVGCKGQATAVAAVSATGGTKPYAYQWSSLNATTDVVTNLPANTYTVTVTDNKGCSQYTDITITEPNTVISATVSGAVTHVSCKSGCNGSATVSGVGGTPPYTYSWSDGQTDSKANNLCAGTYSVVVADNNNCTALISAITITEPTILSAVTSATKTNCGSNTGSVSVTASGGTMPYNYFWSSLGSTTSNALNLGPGVYGVIVSDAHGCTSSADVAVNTFTAPNVTANYNSVVNQLCNGDNMGSVEIIVSGGTPDYTYIWGAGPNENHTTSNTSYTVTNLKAGIHNIVVQDAAGCQGAASPLVTITEPTKVIATISGNDITPVGCKGQGTGCATVSASGGVPGYTYLWTNGAITSNNCNIIAGSYTVIVMDKNSCTAQASVTITEPPTFVSTSVFHQINVSCNGLADGCANISASGGTPAYTYSWSNGVTTYNACNLAAATYTVLVKDANGCSVEQLVTITEPPVLKGVIDDHLTKHAICYGDANGSLSVVAAGGTSPYSYQWQNGPTTSTYNNLTAGTYTVTVTDAHGCNVTTSETVTQPPLIIVAISSSTNGSVCFGNSSDLIATSTSGNKYLWSTGQTTDKITVKPLTDTTYSVTVTNSIGCTGTQSVNVKVKSLPVLDTLDMEVDTATCGTGNGAIKNIQVKGNPTFLYEWKDLKTGKIISHDPHLLDVWPGQYKLIVTDALGCSDSTLQITIPSTPAIIATFTADPTGGEIPLKVQFNYTGQNATQYSWDMGNDSLSNLKDPKTTYISKGEYVVVLTASGNGCVGTATMLVRVISVTHPCDPPNVFTPNDDGTNDKFMMCPGNYKVLVGEIYNRWGEKIFEWNTPNGGWDGRTSAGKPVSDGTYYFIIKAIGQDNQRYEEIGTVELIRQ